jgi:flagellar biogenesis protein FliO
MKFASLLKISILLCAVIVSTIGVSAQNKNEASKTTAQVQQTPPSVQPSAVPFGEEDSIPFMREQEKEAQTSGVSTGGLLIKTLGAMFLIVGLIFFGAWGLKKVGFNPLKKNVETDAPDLAVLSSVSLGTNRTLSVVKFGEKILLVGATAQSFTLLADRGETTSAADELALASPRSVVEMLAEEAAENEQQASFKRDFIEAQKRMNFYEETGGKI